MTHAPRLRAALAGALLAAAALAAPLATPAAAQTGTLAPRAPKLIVALSIDQFSAELYERYRPSFTGGLKRLGEGVSFVNGYQSHAATETCPGHSTILTGRHPAATGIIANSWYDRASGSTLYCVAVKGTADPDARGGQMLRVDTFGDWLKRAQPGARSFAVSGKDRAAIMMGGHHADAIYWWGDNEGFTSSAFAAPATPTVLAPARAFNAALIARWKAAPPALWPTSVSARCAALQKPFQMGAVAMPGTVPPPASLTVETGPNFFARTDFADQLRASPLFDQLVLDFAGQLIDRNRLGRGAATDLLAISLSATDYIGHRYGNGGAEDCVQMAALDAALGGFFARLDALNLPYMVVLTADHGAADAPERAAANGNAQARRVDGAAVVRALNTELRRQFALGYDPVASEGADDITITAGADAALAARMRAAAVVWLKARPEVEAVFTADEIAAVPSPSHIPPTQLSLIQRYAESFDRSRSGDILVAYHPYTTLGVPRAPGDVVAGHGTPWDYDRRVPILFWWPGVTPRAESAAIETVDIAPTLAAIAAVPTPAVDGRCLASVARCPNTGDSGQN
ncbi:alkaline phosphatase family protein [Sphingomonas morindae]|uniref:Alkaline phosphatase n=1 Tax=Sphingomonas morindae TaxID=1541170 RepID=A0ABY4XAZ0_9SPHN|nr:alkaline phosphatase family protein [Sphingomonas morindae]USI74125.1 alkaline phosphatase family protein [Sphingomonas morindae]